VLAAVLDMASPSGLQDVLRGGENGKKAASVTRMIREDREEEPCKSQLLWCFRTD